MMGWCPVDVCGHSDEPIPSEARDGVARADRDLELLGDLHHQTVSSVALPAGVVDLLEVVQIRRSSTAVVLVLWD